MWADVTCGRGRRFGKGQSIIFVDAIRCKQFFTANTSKSRLIGSMRGLFGTGEQAPSGSSQRTKLELYLERGLFV